MPFVTSGDCEIWYETRGNGVPIVVIYGLGDASARWWDAFPDALAERYQVVMLDNRGTGKSGKPKEPWTVDDVIADIDAVAADCGLDRFHLLGCSAGSVFVRQYAAARPERIRSLSLLCAPNGIPATPEDMQAAIFWDPAKPLLESARGSWPIVHPAGWIPGHEAELVADFEAKQAEPTPGRTYRIQLQIIADAPATNAPLNAFTWPVLIVHGSVDRLVPPANADAVKAAIPRARLAILDGMSHNLWQHGADQLVAVVLDFLPGGDA
ncbi:hypothetical protein AYO38_01475 [bacterium SCGC AG-212-C10]|nr:hypothetical protein AYO38_01475 [bacterium SCGC AG-212-C10]